MIAYADVAAISAFLLLTFYMQWALQKFIKEYDSVALEVSDYSVLVTGLPKDATSLEIEDHFNRYAQQCNGPSLACAQLCTQPVSARLHSMLAPYGASICICICMLLLHHLPWRQRWPALPPMHEVWRCAPADGHQSGDAKAAALLGVTGHFAGVFRPQARRAGCAALPPSRVPLVVRLHEGRQDA